MKKPLVLFMIPLLILTGLYTVTAATHPVNGASVGEVCIANAGATSCPLAPPLIVSPSGPPAPQVRLAIDINASSLLNGFDITILTNHTFLKPAGVDRTGTVLQGTLTTLRSCIGDVGTGCTLTDTPDTLHYAVGANAFTSSPVTGLLFTAIYNITGNTHNLPIGFQTGCGSSTSVPGLCITISNGTPSSVPETAQGAKFTDQQYFDFQPLFENSLTVVQGGIDNSLFFNITSINGFSGTVTITAVVSVSGPTAVVTPTSETVSPSNPQNTSSFVTVHVPPTVTPGNYNINFTASSGPLPVNILIIRLIIPTPDFSISANPSNLLFNVSVSGFTIITLTSVANFSGTVNLALTTSPGLNASLSATSFKVNSTSSPTTRLIVNATFAANYVANITATSGSIIHKLTINIVLEDFSMSVPPNTVSVPLGSTAVEPVILQSATGQVYNATVSLKSYVARTNSTTSVNPSQGLTVACPLTANVTSIGTNTEKTNALCKITPVTLGNYTVTVVGVSGMISHSIAFTVTVLGPDFAVVATPTVESIPVGKSSTISLNLTRVLIPAGRPSLNDTIQISANFFGQSQTNFPTISLNVQKVFLNSTSPYAIAIITVTASMSTPVGAYTLLVTAFAQKNTITHIAAIVVVVVTTTSPHDLEVTSVNANPTSATIGDNVTITILVQNLGKVAENSTVIALAGDLSVAQQTFTLAAGQNMTFTLIWQTTGFSPGAYTIGGKVLGVPGQTNYSSNVLRWATPITLSASNMSVLQSPYFLPSIIIGLIIVIAAVLVFFLQARRKTPK